MAQVLPNKEHPAVVVLNESEEYRFGGLFRIIRAQLQFQQFDQHLSDPITRICFERGDSVGVLLYDPKEDAVILVRQFRYPVYTRLTEAEQQGEGVQQAWLLEIVAGVQDEGHTVKEIASRELLEEAGYAVTGDLQPITIIYASPGATSERIHVFWGAVDQHERLTSGGGVAAEGEDIEIVVVPFAEALTLIAENEICDAKTVIALQHLALINSVQSSQKVHTS